MSGAGIPSHPSSSRRLPVVGDPEAHVAAGMACIREGRARLQDFDATWCDPHAGRCAAPRPCAGQDAVDDALRIVTAAEAQLGTALDGTALERKMLGQLAHALQEIASIQRLGDLLAKIPMLALRICFGAAAALLQVGADGSVELVSRCGAETEESRVVEEEVRLAARSGRPRSPGGRGDNGSPNGTCPGEGAVVMPLAYGADGLVLVVDPPEPGAPLRAPELARLSVYSSLAGTAVARVRSAEALREAGARHAATLAAIRDAVVDVGTDGAIRAINPPAAAMLRVRREDVVGRRLREVPALCGLAEALAASRGHAADVVTCARGDVLLRAQPYEGGLVVSLHDASGESRVSPPRSTGASARFGFEDLVGGDPAFVRVLEEARRAARSDVPILICGESGTGKEMLAQAIHNASGRATEPFLGINVTAIPRELLESELFGYEGGAFTGARTSGRAGKFELAGRGTLLLDELADMPLDMQTKLLRVLQERLVERLGGSRDVAVRARVIATSGRDLAEAVRCGQFRLDLYHRLCVLELHLPPLRERLHDVPLIVEHHLRNHAQADRRHFRVAPHVMEALLAYEWPGNVRQLLNVIDGEISVLPPGASELTRVPAALRASRREVLATARSDAEVVPLEELERRACQHALAAFEGNVARAARALGVAKGTLYSKMERYGIPSLHPRLPSPTASPRRTHAGGGDVGSPPAFLARARTT